MLKQRLATPLFMGSVASFHPVYIAMESVEFLSSLTNNARG